MDFIAIDFETANSRSDSACQIGIAIVQNNIITETRSWLIKPSYGGFNPFFIDIHGITPSHVTNEPMFDELWGILKPYFVQNNLLIAHNAGFDANVLFNTLKSFEIAVPELTVACTVAMARRTWVGERSYSLGALANKFDIQFRHHDAGEDARACAEIAIKVFKQHEVHMLKLDGENIDSIGNSIGVQFGSIDEYGYTNCRCLPKARQKK